MILIVLGCIGAVAYVGFVVTVALKRGDSWTEAGKRSDACTQSGLDVHGGAWVGSQFVSVPLARIAADHDALTVCGRWRWIPIPPTTISHSEIAGSSIRRTATGSRRLEFERVGTAQRFCIWIRPEAVEHLISLGWPVTLSS